MLLTRINPARSGSSRFAIIAQALNYVRLGWQPQNESKQFRAIVRTLERSSNGRLNETLCQCTRSLGLARVPWPRNMALHRPTEKQIFCDFSVVCAEPKHGELEKENSWSIYITLEWSLDSFTKCRPAHTGLKQLSASISTCIHTPNVGWWKKSGANPTTITTNGRSQATLHRNDVNNTRAISMRRLFCKLAAWPPADLSAFPVTPAAETALEMTPVIRFCFLCAMNDLIKITRQQIPLSVMGKNMSKRAVKKSPARLEDTWAHWLMGATGKRDSQPKFPGRTMANTMIQVPTSIVMITGREQSRA